MGVEKQGFLSFDPVKLMETSVKMDKQYKCFNTVIDSIRKHSITLQENWKGDCSELYLNKIKALDNSSEEMVKELLTLSQKLASVSGSYTKGEADAKIKAEALPTEGVFLV